MNTQDSSSAIRQFRKDFKLTMPLLLGSGDPKSVPKLYGVVVTPTNYVLDKDGKVVAQIIGGDMDAINEALAKLGVK